MKLPQLSLRELFLLVALVAMGCGWWVDRQSANDRLDECQQRLFDTEESLKNWSGQAELIANDLSEEGIEFKMSEHFSTITLPAKDEYQRPVAKRLRSAQSNQ